MTDLKSIMRPNGRPYRPRKLTAHPVTGYDEEDRVVVFGTHDPAVAQPLADRCVARFIDSGYRAADPVLVWWRDGMDGGRRRWVTDEIGGRAGVWFRELVEADHD